jgi:hypothetical protein
MPDIAQVQQDVLITLLDCLIHNLAEHIGPFAQPQLANGVDDDHVTN